MTLFEVEPILKANGRQKATNRGSWYRSTYNGKVLVEATTEPFYNSVRELVKIGVTGQVGMVVAGQLRLTADALTAQEIAISENDKGIRAVKYKEFERWEEPEDDDDEGV